MTKRELEALPTTALASLCERLASVSVHDDPIAEVCHKLVREWASLQTPPSTDLKAEEVKDAKLQDIRTRMVAILQGSSVDYFPKG